VVLDRVDDPSWWGHAVRRAEALPAVPTVGGAPSTGRLSPEDSDGADRFAALLRAELNPSVTTAGEAA
jgi:hypothetical protein